MHQDAWMVNIDVVKLYKIFATEFGDHTTPGFSANFNITFKKVDILFPIILSNVFETGILFKLSMTDQNKSVSL